VDWVSYEEGNWFSKVGFLGNFCATLLVPSLTSLGTRSEACNILVLKCIGCVEPRDKE
jgi:hypothetical protein